MIRNEEMKKEAREALYSISSRSNIATGKPLFTTGFQSLFFKNLNIPSVKVVYIYIYNILRVSCNQEFN